MMYVLFCNKKNALYVFMAMRNLTEPFILMRNNALQSKHIYAEQVCHT